LQPFLFRGGRQNFWLTWQRRTLRHLGLLQTERSTARGQETGAQSLLNLATYRLETGSRGVGLEDEAGRCGIEFGPRSLGRRFFGSGLWHRNSGSRWDDDGGWLPGTERRYLLDVHRDRSSTGLWNVRFRQRLRALDNGCTDRGSGHCGGLPLPTPVRLLGLRSLDPLLHLTLLFRCSRNDRQQLFWER
jgi:hypothetical protein